MYDTIYIESDIVGHPIAKRIVTHYSKAKVVECRRFTELFNRRNQDFRLQKRYPSLILARKHDNHVLKTPIGYGLGGTWNYYFSIMLNCMYDCRYCFLQGMYQSANHVVFVNYEDFCSGIDECLSMHPLEEKVWFFSGYDCDSLAMEPMLGFADYFIDVAETRSNLWLELRTKSTQIRTLLARKAVPNVVVGFSFTPNEISTKLELRVPSVKKRILAMSQLQSHGWKVGIRLDPLIYSRDYQELYRKLIEDIFSKLDPHQTHSATIGVFRLPNAFYRKLERLYPDDEFVVQPFHERNGQVSYPQKVEQEMKSWCYRQLSETLDTDRIFFDDIRGHSK